jgi:hypothetical protein
MIGLVVVFAIVAAAYIALNSQQMSLARTQNEISELNHDRNNEKLTVEVIGCQSADISNADWIDIQVNNTGSDTARLMAFLLTRTNPMNVTDAKDVWVDKTDDVAPFSIHFTKDSNHGLPMILALESKTFRIEDNSHIAVTNGADIQYATSLLIITELGNEIVDSYNFETSCLPP